MKRIQFQYVPANLEQTARHLANQGDFPKRAEPHSTIESSLRKAVVTLFSESYRGRRLHGTDVENDLQHAPCLWRSITCSFFSVRPTERVHGAFHADAEIDAASDLTAVHFTLHVILGVQRPNVLVLQDLGNFIDAVDNAQTSMEKGESLETLMAYLFSGVPGFRVVDRNLHTSNEEIDIVVENCEGSPFQRDQQYVVVECKNWSSSCGKNEIVALRDKIENRRGRCTLGFLVSWRGFARTLEVDQLRHSRDKNAVGLISGSEIRGLLDVLQYDVSDMLKKAVYDEVFK